jgi:hypothetical protein
VTPSTAFRAFAALISAALSVILFALVMAFTGTPLSPAFPLAAAASGAGFGWWRSGRTLSRRPPTPKEPRP